MKTHKFLTKEEQKELHKQASATGLSMINRLENMQADRKRIIDELKKVTAC